MDPDANMLVRAEINGLKDKEKQQTVKVLGRDSEQLGGQQFILRIQAHGFDSVPPKGSQGVLLIMGGSPDMAMMIGGEHPDHRPTDKEDGASVQYDSNGNTHLMDSNGHTQVSKKDYKMTIEGDLTIVVKGTVIIDCPDINLGGTGGDPILLTGGTELGRQAARVKAI